jgi:nicotinamidase-related amidase
MTAPKTLLQMAGADLTPAKLANASLVVIDAQNEYRDGALPLDGVGAAIAAGAELLAAARERGAPIFHIAHKGRPGGAFDRAAHRGQIVAEMTPAAGEPVIEKGLPNAFAGTDLAARLAATGRKDVVIIGFMTHMCVSSTARAALDLGYRVTIDAAACATRDLPKAGGGVIPAATLHDVALAELADRFAIVTPNATTLL